MRCFIAINLDDSLRNEIGEAVGALKKGDWDVGWIKTENLHLTLKFLGESSEDLIEALKEKLSIVASGCGSFDLNLHGSGFFPDKKRPRVIWINMFETSGSLLKLQELVEVSTLSFGYKRETRDFSPHLTIGRVRSQKGIDTLVKAMEALKDRDFGNMQVDKFSLMKSDLRPTGAHYSTLKEFHFNKEER